MPRYAATLMILFLYADAATMLIFTLMRRCRHFISSPRDAADTFSFAPRRRHDA